MIKPLILILTLLLATPAIGLTEKFQFEKDVSYDGIPDQLTYEVSAKNWERPVSWSLNIEINGQSVFHHSAEGEDSAFWGEPGYVENCEGFTACREEWYLRQLPDVFSYSIGLNESNRDEIFNVFLAQGPDYYVSELNKSEPEALESTLKLYEFLKNRTIECILTPASPVNFGGLMTFDKFSNQFVVLYRP